MRRNCVFKTRNCVFKTRNCVFKDDVAAEQAQAGALNIS